MLHRPRAEHQQSGLTGVGVGCRTTKAGLRYELFRGRLSQADFEASEAGLTDFIKARGNTKPHLADLM